MQYRPLAGLFLALCLSSATTALPAAQAPTASSVPILVGVSGQLKTPTGDPRTGSVTLVFSIYVQLRDVQPIWTEEQAVSLDADGRYAAYVGATLPGGIPIELLSGPSQAHWVGVAVLGEPEQFRMMMAAYPYAAHSSEADTLTGRKATDFVLASDLNASVNATVTQRLGSASTSTLVPAIGTSGFASNYLLKDNGSGSGLDSTILESGGKVGINTSSPAYGLDVVTNGPGDNGLRVLSTGDYPSNLYFSPNHSTNAGSRNWLFQADGTQFGSLEFRVSNARGGNPYSAGTSVMLLDRAGNVGIGTNSPAFRLDLLGSAFANDGLRVQSTSGYPANIYFEPNGTNAASRNWLFQADGTQFGSFEIRRSNANAADPYSSSTSTSVMLLDRNGNVGIGTTSPSVRLDVSGAAHVSGDMTVNGNIAAKYQDVAEWVPASAPLADGTVVIIDPAAPNRVTPSSRAYDTRVAGAVSPQPGLVLGQKGDSKALVAQSGRVRVKVDASYGAIHAGDLLVTSPTPGYAMRSKPITIGGQIMHRPGTILGKALESLSSGKGEILVLLTLQ